MNEFNVHTIVDSSFARLLLATLVEKRAAFTVAPVVPGTPEVQREPAS